LKPDSDFSSECRCGADWIDQSVNHYELVVPMYKARELISELLVYIEELRKKLPCAISVTFVLDGDIDDTRSILLESLQYVAFKWKILKLSRNFGVGPALIAAFERSNACIVTAFGADLQEPDAVFVQFLEVLSDPEKHIALGVRKSREDPFFAQKASQIYWFLFTRFISPDLPSGGFDVCALSREARISLCSMEEKNTNITAQIDWLGFSREYVYFDRQSRKIGKSSWKISRKIKLFMDSFYGFTDLPIVFLLLVSSLGILITSVFGLLILISWFLGRISVPGYASVILLQIFSTNLILFVISVVSGYSTRAFENSKARPRFIVEAIIESK
jgi:hypothetical protein